MCSRSLLAVLSTMAVFTRGVWADEPAPGKQVAQLFQEAQPREQLGFLLYLPEKYGQPNERFPLLLFLHGSGERGQDISLVKKHGPPMLIGRGRHFPFIVVSPQCPADGRWDSKQLLALLDDLGARYSIDSKRVYVTGLSMGGAGTWSLIAAAPDRFAAAVPICGHGSPWMTAPASNLPIWVVVGDRDRVAGNCLGMVDALRRRGADVKWTLMHGVGHDSWTATYATPELYEWMLRHHLPD